MRTYAQAVAWAEAQRLHPTQDWTFRCQMFSRNCVGAAAWANSALKSWNAIPAAHKHTGAPRAGSIAYFDEPGRVGEAGHAVFVVGGGYCYSTDILRKGKIDKVPLSLIHDKWGMRYLGWIDWTPSGAINLAPVTPTVPKAVKPVSLSKVRPGYFNGHVTTVQQALKAEGLYGFAVNGRFDANTKAAYSKWQKKLGYTGSDADGVPGRTSLTKLGAKHGFSVVA